VPAGQGLKADFVDENALASLVGGLLQPKVSSVCGTRRRAVAA